VCLVALRSRVSRVPCAVPWICARCVCRCVESRVAAGTRGESEKARCRLQVTRYLVIYCTHFTRAVERQKSSTYSSQITIHPKRASKVRDHVTQHTTPSRVSRSGVTSLGPRRAHVCGLRRGSAPFAAPGATRTRRPRRRRTAVDRLVLASSHVIPERAVTVHRHTPQSTVRNDGNGYSVVGSHRCVAPSKRQSRLCRGASAPPTAAAELRGLKFWDPPRVQFVAQTLTRSSHANLNGASQRGFLRGTATRGGWCQRSCESRTRGRGGEDAGTRTRGRRQQTA